MMNEQETRVRYVGDAGTVDQVVEALRKEEVVVLPCDTIYGLCAKADETTRRKLMALKGRDQKKPFLQLATLPMAEAQCVVPDAVKAVWPCALTAIMQDRNDDGTTAIRVPKDAFLQKVLERLGSPIFSTSVNTSGSSALTNLTDIVLAFNGKVGLVVADGEKQGTVPSTLIDCTVHPYRILRKGSYDASALING